MAKEAKLPVIEERKYTPAELPDLHKLHVTTIRDLFFDEEGVIRIGHPTTRNRRQHFTLRIPQSVAERVFARMTVARKAR